MVYPDATSYARTEIDLTGLASLAARTARETQAGRHKHSRKTPVQKTRTVRTGLFGLIKRVNNYTEYVVEEVVADYWILEQRYWKRREKRADGSLQEVTFNGIYYCLGIDGSLFVRTDSYEETYMQTGEYVRNDNESSTRPMNTVDVMLLDFAANYSLRTEGRVSYETNREADPNGLKYQVKGAGISTALNQLLQRSS